MSPRELTKEEAPVATLRCPECDNADISQMEVNDYRAARKILSVEEGVIRLGPATPRPENYIRCLRCSGLWVPKSKDWTLRVEGSPIGS